MWRKSMSKKKQQETIIRPRLTVAVNNRKKEYFLDALTLDEIKIDVNGRLDQAAAKVGQEIADAQQLAERLQHPGGIQQRFAGV